MPEDVERLDVVVVDDDLERAKVATCLVSGHREQF